MVARSLPSLPDTEDLLATLADAAYRAALRRGLNAPFVDVQLDIWKALRGALNRETLAVGIAEEETADDHCQPILNRLRRDAWGISARVEVA